VLHVQASTRARGPCVRAAVVTVAMDPAEATWYGGLIDGVYGNFRACGVSWVSKATADSLGVVAWASLLMIGIVGALLLVFHLAGYCGAFATLPAS
jgi:hypothetical protein